MKKLEKVWFSVDPAFKFTETQASNTKNSSNTSSLKISGVIMPEGKISRNGVLYNFETIEPEKLINKPLMYNHQTEGRSDIPVGHITNSRIENGNWLYEAVINPRFEEITSAIKHGDLRHVSIQLKADSQSKYESESNRQYEEAFVEDIIELSLVPCPGFLDSTIAFAESIRHHREDVGTTQAPGALTAELPKKEQTDYQADGAHDHPQIWEEIRAIKAKLGLQSENCADVFISDIGEDEVAELLQQHGFEVKVTK